MLLSILLHNSKSGDHMREQKKKRLFYDELSHNLSTSHSNCVDLIGSSETIPSLKVLFFRVDVVYSHTCLLR